MKRRRLWLPVAVLVASAVIVYATRGPDQPQVDVGQLPLVAGTQVARVFVDCSKVNDVAYFADNPCQAFVLLRNVGFGSVGAFWAAETRRLSVAEWRHSAAQLVDYDGLGDDMASATDSWVAPGHHACAYVATVRTGVASETRELFPKDTFDIPQGVYDFYAQAQAAREGRVLWVRLRPPNRGGRCIG